MEQFTLTVLIEGHEIDFDVRVGMYGYCYKFYICIDAVEVIFKKDEEGNIRSIVADHLEIKNSLKTKINAIGLELAEHFGH